jgi:hypothetical protein
VPPVAVPPPPEDPSQYVPPELNPSQGGKPSNSIFRRFFKGGQQ